jgi:hypothetical protein
MLCIEITGAAKYAPVCAPAERKKWTIKKRFTIGDTQRRAICKQPVMPAISLREPIDAGAL